MNQSHLDQCAATYVLPLLSFLYLTFFMLIFNAVKDIVEFPYYPTCVTFERWVIICQYANLEFVVLILCCDELSNIFLFAYLTVLQLNRVDI